jgi:polysaccharide deacetylase 2 family uncharacterized protein YibQ
MKNSIDTIAKKKIAREEKIVILITSITILATQNFQITLLTMLITAGVFAFGEAIKQWRIKKKKN